LADLSSLLGAAGIGGTIGKAIVNLELDTKKYTAEMQAAQSQTVASTNAMGSSTSKFSSIASSALLGVGVAAVAGAAVSVKAAIEANEAHLKLQNTFENNARLSDSSVAAFERQANALRDLTGVDDEAIITGQALLGSFKLTGEQVQELTPRVVDLAAKYDIDLQAAFKAVGKATQGSAGILSRYGIILDENALKADAFGTTLEGLGVAAGFAEDRAKLEPWRVLGAQWEEIAERIGNALLPALQGLSEILIRLVPLIEGVGDALMLAFSSETYTDIPVIGEAFHILGVGIQAVRDAINTSTPPAERFRDTIQDTAPAISQTEKECREYAKALREATDKSGDLNKATRKVKDDIEDFTLALDENAEQTKITRQEFVHATNVMQREAENLNTAVKRISREKWINEEYVKFLSEQGPEWLIGFADLTEKQQRKAQDAWEESTKKTDHANRSLETIVGTLDKLDQKTTKHKIEIVYEYSGFDPTKPGMGTGTAVRGRT